MTETRAFRLVAVALLLGACSESPTGPRPLAITLDRAAQFSGDVVTIVAPELSRLTLIPESDSAPRPNRWANLHVLVGGDSAESWRVAPDSIAFRVPPLYTGIYAVEVHATGFDSAGGSLQVVGQAYPVYAALHAYTNALSGTAWPGHGLLVGETFNWPGYGIGYGLIDAQQKQLAMFPELAADSVNRAKMFVPGPSYRPDHFVFDLSPTGPGKARVWQLAPTRQLVDSIPCASNGTYTAADIAPGVCLLSRGYSILRNGTDTIVPFHAAYLESEFRMAAGGEWTVPRTRLDFNDLGPLPWPVFDAAGNVAYSIDTLRYVTGAAFSANGDTLYATVAAADPAYQNGLRWSLMVLTAATGTMISSRAFPSGEYLQDVLVDPIHPRLYVASIAGRQRLTILDRATLAPLGTITAPTLWQGDDGTLVYGGASGRVHAFVHCGFDCGGMWDHAFDVFLP